MIKKSDIVKEAVQKKEWKKALQIAKDFHIGVTQEERDKMARAYECIVHPDFYRQIGMDISEAIEQGKAIVKKYAESRRKNSMKWDVKHDRAKGIIDEALDFTEKEKIAGLTEKEVGEVNRELTLMNYKLQERLADQKPQIQPKEDGMVISRKIKKKTLPESINEAEKGKKMKRTGKKTESIGEKKERKPKAKKEGEAAE